MRLSGQVVEFLDSIEMKVVDHSKGILKPELGDLLMTIINENFPQFADFEKISKDKYMVKTIVVNMDGIAFENNGITYTKDTIEITNLETIIKSLNSMISVFSEDVELINLLNKSVGLLNDMILKYEKMGLDKNKIAKLVINKKKILLYLTNKVGDYCLDFEVLYYD